ncbi:hypothetical protein BJV78DRAFT_1280480 [Lactifluus subvellereus]|nr:hypothetical protein BJV78DRAFT_1280480 [Lactifluus subvellereus]
MSTPSPVLPFSFSDDGDDETHMAHEPCVNPTSHSLRRPGRAFAPHLHSATAAMESPSWRVGRRWSYRALTLTATTPAVTTMSSEATSQCVVRY